MDDLYYDAICYLMVLIICGICLWFIWNYYHLQKFRDCYLNNFRYNYCEKYLDY